MPSLNKVISESGPVPLVLPGPDTAAQEKAIADAACSKATADLTMECLRSLPLDKVTVTTVM